MVKYVEIENAFQTIKDLCDSNPNAMDIVSPSEEAENLETGSSTYFEQLPKYLIFIAVYVMLMNVSKNGRLTVRINKIPVEIATIYFNKAISFVPCFKYVDSEDVILFASPNIKYLVDKGGQFATDYYGMKHELMECIFSEEVYVDLNDICVQEVPIVRVIDRV